MKIPDNTIKRLPLYLSVLEQFGKENCDYIASVDLEKVLDIKPSVLRKDLSYFGALGVRGKGYRIDLLSQALRRIIGISDRHWRTVVIGCGNIGTALMRYLNFSDINLEISAGFDADPKKINKTIAGVPIYALDSLLDIIEKEGIEFVILTAPLEAALPIVENLAKNSKIRGIVNFTQKYIKAPKHIRIVNIGITTKMLTMFFYLKNTTK
jgi:redox-sensing transcriptional repressor